MLDDTRDRFGSELRHLPRLRETGLSAQGGTRLPSTPLFVAGTERDGRKEENRRTRKARSSMTVLPKSRRLEGSRRDDVEKVEARSHVPRIPRLSVNRRKTGSQGGKRETGRRLDSGSSECHESGGGVLNLRAVAQRHFGRSRDAIQVFSIKTFRQRDVPDASSSSPTEAIARRDTPCALLRASGQPRKLKETRERKTRRRKRRELPTKRNDALFE
ncbi:hypothetical protein KM043_002876 [Ampulex compressa]|nr:hypothetical protein KM043_002876 [Ampulex compressa]